LKRVTPLTDEEKARAKENTERTAATKAARDKEEEYKESLVKMMHKTDRADFKEARAIQKERSDAADALKQKEAMEAAAQEEASKDPQAELA